MKDILFWSEKSDLAAEDSFPYWNDEEIESRKKFRCAEDRKEGNGFIKYLNDSGLMSDYRKAVALAEENGGARGKILDAASGVCWTSALLSKKETVREVDALDFSFHRLQQIAPHVFKLFSAEESKINRILGSFYEIKRSQGYYDTVLFSQAFHHAADPARLLKETARVLRPGGCVIVSGETVITRFRFLKRMAGKLLREGCFSNRFEELFPPDPVSGDFRYTKKHYRRMFGNSGFSIVSWHVPHLIEFGSFIAIRK